jgi:outer membrane protein W
MKNRVALAALALMLFGARNAQAQDHKFEITPFAGYETSGSYPVTTSFTVDRLRADGNVSFGTFVNYSLTSYFEPEFLWTHNPSSFSQRDAATGIYSKAFNTQIDQFQFGGSFLFRNPDAKLRPYVGAGLGFTHDGNSGGNPNRTAFAYSFGGGAKYYATKHLGFRFDARFLPTYGSSSPGLVCDAFGFCYTAQVHNYLNRGNFSVGIILRP